MKRRWALAAALGFAAAVLAGLWALPLFLPDAGWGLNELNQIAGIAALPLGVMSLVFGAAALAPPAAAPPRVGGDGSGRADAPGGASDPVVVELTTPGARLLRLAKGTGSALGLPLFVGMLFYVGYGVVMLIREDDGSYAWNAEVQSHFTTFLDWVMTAPVGSLLLAAGAVVLVHVPFAVAGALLRESGQDLLILDESGMSVREWPWPRIPSNSDNSWNSRRDRSFSLSWRDVESARVEGAGSVYALVVEFVEGSDPDFSDHRRYDFEAMKDGGCVVARIQGDGPTGARKAARVREALRRFTSENDRA